MLGSYQFSRSDEYYYRTTSSGPFDQLAEFRHLVLINHVDLGLNYYVIDNKFKVAIGVAGTVSRTITIYGDPLNGISPHIPFTELPHSFSCSICEAPKSSYHKLEEVLFA